MQHSRRPPDGVFMAQVARNLTDAEDGFLRAHRFMICDRDAKFTAEFRSLLRVTGVDVIRTPRQAPNCNAYAERFVLSIKSTETSDQILVPPSRIRQLLGGWLLRSGRSMLSEERPRD